MLSSLEFPAPFLGSFFRSEIGELQEKQSLCVNSGCHRGWGEEERRQDPRWGSSLPGHRGEADLTGQVSL